jgi:hypothetical protein
MFFSSVITSGFGRRIGIALRKSKNLGAAGGARTQLTA